MKQGRRISLASGVLPEFDAFTLARAAASAGYSDAGFMVRPDAWPAEREAELRDLLAESGVGVLDVEVLWIPAGGELDEGQRLIVDVGNRLGADNLLVVSDEADPERLAPALQEISDRAAASGMRPCLEFLRITRVQSLAQARELLDACRGHNFGILLDTLHLARSGELANPGDLDPTLHPYIQLCDGRRQCAEDPQSLLQDAVDGRSAPGEGELELRALLARLPDDLPLSLEVRSRPYRERYPDPGERAAAVLDQTRTFLGG